MAPGPILEREIRQVEIIASYRRKETSDESYG